MKKITLVLIVSQIFSAVALADLEQFIASPRFENLTHQDIQVLREALTQEGDVQIDGRIQYRLQKQIALGIAGLAMAGGGIRMAIHGYRASKAVVEATDAQAKAKTTFDAVNVKVEEATRLALDARSMELEKRGAIERYSLEARELYERVRALESAEYQMTPEDQAQVLSKATGLRRATALDLKRGQAFVTLLTHEKTPALFARATETSPWHEHAQAVSAEISNIEERVAFEQAVQRLAESKTGADVARAMKNILSIENPEVKRHNMGQALFAVGEGIEGLRTEIATLDKIIESAKGSVVSNEVREILITLNQEELRLIVKARLAAETYVQHPSTKENLENLRNARTKLGSEAYQAAMKVDEADRNLVYAKENISMRRFLKNHKATTGTLALATLAVLGMGVHEFIASKTHAITLTEAERIEALRLLDQAEAQLAQ